MSTVEGTGQREEGEYGRAAKRLKTEEREEREEGEELEEGEDSDSGSLPGNGESVADNRARWSSSQYGAGRRDNGEDSHRISPSPVVHVRGLCEAVVEADLIDALEKFGPIWFESVQCAQKAKAALNGADIYAGCCTLKIEYARPTRLNVIKNDNESWDYTKPYLVRRDRGKGSERAATL
ncbi:heterogeneous nuclear ribonucleoprotein L-like isoform X2 [Lates japonicus]|uniref:Heterogeneous nuclear ribonucleoprotein L-like isoform X2 n=1 Tax=Lates japonicus TaxID=270547 RepID=A0AAD3N5C5_LATJO|nr:heterogeneous nuclear ribonucleoprotein L-like isoform X2 [Lates japonicus]